MTTAKIESLANAGGLATADIDIGAMLRRVVIPKFLLDVDQEVGKTYWRRATTTINVVNPTRNYDLPNDFDWLESARPYGSENSEYGVLDYIGEDATQVQRSETTSTAARPTGFYLVTGSSTPYAMRLNTVPDTSYTMVVVYYKRIPFTNDVESVDLDAYIPAQFQGALIPALRAEIMDERFGVGDPRGEKEKAKYDGWIMRLKDKKEGAARSHVRMVN